MSSNQFGVAGGTSPRNLSPNPARGTSTSPCNLSGGTIPPHPNSPLPPVQVSPSSTFHSAALANAVGNPRVGLVSPPPGSTPPHPGISPGHTPPHPGALLSPCSTPPHSPTGPFSTTAIPSTSPFHPHVTSPSSSSSLPAPKRISCEECRKRHESCDRKQPRCTSCVRRNLKCYYPIRKKWTRRTPSDNNLGKKSDGNSPRKNGSGNGNGNSLKQEPDGVGTSNLQVTQRSAHTSRSPDVQYKRTREPRKRVESFPRPGGDDGSRKKQRFGACPVNLTYSPPPSSSTSPISPAPSPSNNLSLPSPSHSISSGIQSPINSPTTTPSPSMMAGGISGDRSPPFAFPSLRVALPPLTGPPLFAPTSPVTTTSPTQLALPPLTSFSAASASERTLLPSFSVLSSDPQGKPQQPPQKKGSVPHSLSSPVNQASSTTPTLPPPSNQGISFRRPGGVNLHVTEPDQSDQQLQQQYQQQLQQLQQQYQQQQQQQQKLFQQQQQQLQFQQLQQGVPRTSSPVCSFSSNSTISPRQQNNSGFSSSFPQFPHCTSPTPVSPASPVSPPDNGQSLKKNFPNGVPGMFAAPFPYAERQGKLPSVRQLISNSSDGDDTDMGLRGDKQLEQIGQEEMIFYQQHGPEKKAPRNSTRAIICDSLANEEYQKGLVEKSPLPMVGCICPVFRTVGGLKLGRPKTICRNARAAEMFPEQAPVEEQFHPVSQKKVLEEVEKYFVAPPGCVVQELYLGLSVNNGNGTFSDYATCTNYFYNSKGLLSYATRTFIPITLPKRSSPFGSLLNEYQQHQIRFEEREQRGGNNSENVDMCGQEATRDTGVEEEFKRSATIK